MKKQMLLFAWMSLVFIQLTFAQTSSTSEDQKFHFGFKVSPTLAWIKTDSPSWSRNGSNLGFSYGLQTEFSITENYAFATGLQVTYRGGKVKYQPSPDSSFSAKLKIQYLELPVTLKLKTKQFDKFRYFGQFGLVPGFKLRAKADDFRTDYPAKSTVQDNVDVLSSVKNMNLNMMVAAGAEYTLAGSTVMVASIEFNNGFLDIFKSFDSGVNNNNVYLKGFTNYFALNIGILF